MAYRYKNLRKLEEVSTEYKGSKVYAFKWEYEVLNDKGREVTQREIVCNLYRVGSTNQPLNLGEMSDGSKFTAVAQAVNEAKWLVDYYLEKEVDRKLLSLGFLREDLFKFNKFRMYERLEMKEKLLK